MTSAAFRRVRFSAPDVVEVLEADPLEPGPGEVLVRSHVIGICGSDLHALAGAHPFIDLPCDPGHEVAGEVVRVGEGVEGFAPGQRVLVEPNLVCGTCHYCREGRYNICENLLVFGCQTAGAMTDEFVIRVDRLHTVPDGMSDEAAALVEPMATATRAVRAAGGDLTGQRVAILGAGSIGLLTMWAAKAAGAAAVAVTDLLASKRDRALRLGAVVAVDGAAGDAVDRLGDALGFRPDVTFDCVTNQASTDQAVALATKGGTVVVLGVPTDPVTLQLPIIQDREIRLQGSLMYVREDVERAMELVGDPQFPVGEFVTAVFELEQAAEAFETAREGEQVKVQLRVGS